MLAPAWSGFRPACGSLSRTLPGSSVHSRPKGSCGSRRNRDAAASVLPGTSCRGQYFGSRPRQVFGNSRGPAIFRPALGGDDDHLVALEEAGRGEDVANVVVNDEHFAACEDDIGLMQALEDFPLLDGEFRGVAVQPECCLIQQS